MGNPIQDAVADMQTPGTSVTMEAGGQSATIEDPEKVVERAAGHASEVDPATDPWPGEEEYVESRVLAGIAEVLIGGLVRLRHLHRFEVRYVFRSKKTWEKKGKSVLGDMKRPTGLLRKYADCDFICRIHWESWQAMNPMQRVALIYHELRHGNDEGKVNPHDFEGFFDELELFGTRTYQDWNRLAQAAEDGAEVTHQYSLPLLEVS